MSEFYKLVDTLKESLSLAKHQMNELKKKSDLIDDMAYSFGGYLWRKDNNYRYLFCDKVYCKLFYNIEPEQCEQGIYGFTDIELCEAFGQKTGQLNSTSMISFYTDEHCRQMEVRSRYIEMAMISDNMIVLDIIKTPLFDIDKNFIGLIGFAVDRSDVCIDMKEFIQRRLTEKTAHLLYKDNRSFAYYMYKKNQSLECVFPEDR